MAEVKAELKLAAAKANRQELFIFAIQMDVSSEDDVKRAVEETTIAFGEALDILVNNAGWTEYPSKIADSDPIDWWRTWEVNIKGVYLCSRYFLPAILRSTSKTIINVTSGAAVGISSGASGYGGTKFALCRFSEHLHLGYSNEGLICHLLEPGSVLTNLADRLHKDFHPYLTDTAQLPAHTAVWLVAERREWLSQRYVTAKWDMAEMEQKRAEIEEEDLLRFCLAV